MKGTMVRNMPTAIFLTNRIRSAWVMVLDLKMERISGNIPRQHDRREENSQPPKTFSRRLTASRDISGYFYDMNALEQLQQLSSDRRVARNTTWPGCVSRRAFCKIIAFIGE
jgi:hypothetical protein